jgi:carnitine 3-dehydrogenase
VRPEWIDYNGHMTDARYFQVFGDAVDVLLRRLGIDEAYRAAGSSPFTAETHVAYLAEVGQNESIHVTTQVLDVDPKRFRLFHRLVRSRDDVIAATAEQLWLHVDTRAGKTAPMPPAVLAGLEALLALHAKLPRPAAAGRGIAMQKG